MGKEEIPNNAGILRLNNVDEEQHSVLNSRIKLLGERLGFLLNNSVLGGRYKSAFESKQRGLWSFKGDLSLLNDNRLIAVTGAREINNREQGALTAFVQMFCQVREDYPSGLLCTQSNPKGSVIMSGLAIGSDSVFSQVATSYGAITCGVLPSRVPISPDRGSLEGKIIDNGGLLISPQVQDVNLGDHSAYHYHWRNFLLAVMADVLVVGPGAAKGGTMSTVEFAAMAGTPLLFIVGSNHGKSKDEEYNNAAMLNFLHNYTGNAPQYLEELSGKAIVEGVYGTAETSAQGRTQRALVPFAVVQGQANITELASFLFTTKYRR